MKRENVAWIIPLGSRFDHCYFHISRFTFHVSSRHAFFLLQPLCDVPIAVIDVETTGLSAEYGDRDRSWHCPA